MDEINEIYVDPTKDDKLAEVIRAWSQCMADEGLEFKNPDEAINSIADEQAQIPFDEASGTQDAAAVAELKKKEITTAVADRKCQDKVQYQKKQLQAQFDREREFLDAHRAELDAMVAKYESSK